MATTNIRPIKRRLDHVINYASNEIKTKNNEYGIYKYQDLHNVIEYAESDYKTEKRLYVTGLNCSSQNAYKHMQATKEAWNKKDGVLAYHLIQSFDEGEVTPELAHKIGIELCNELFSDRFECVVATHLNTKHYHNHIVINSVSFKDGKKYYDNHQSYSIIRRMSDNICKEYGLSVIEEKECKKSNLNYNNFLKKYDRENNYENSSKRDLDNAINNAYTFKDFVSIMNKYNYQVYIRSGKISIRNSNYNRNIRIERTFGEEYSIDNIKKRISEKNHMIINDKVSKKINITKYKYSFSKKKKVKGIVALYYHYCYLLKVFPFYKESKRIKYSNVLKEEIKKLDKYSSEAKLLLENKLETKEDLKEYKQKSILELNNLLALREKNWRTRKISVSNEEKEILNRDISSQSNKIKLLRKKLNLIEDIEDRMPRIKETIEELEKQERKEKNKNEYI